MKYIYLQMKVYKRSICNGIIANKCYFPIFNKKMWKNWSKVSISKYIIVLSTPFRSKIR